MVFVGIVSFNMIAIAQQDSIPPAGVQGSPNPMSDNSVSSPGFQLLDESFPNSWAIPGSGIRLKVYGFVKLDMIHDLDYIGNPWEFETAFIPMDGSPEAALGGLTTLHAKQSRLGFEFRSTATSKNGKQFPLKAVLEIDFFEDDPSLARQPRLRHAYGMIGRFLAGQYWSTTADLNAIPGLIDFAGGDALYGTRVPQIRWEDKAGKILSYAVALEQPSSVVANPSDLEGESRPRMPNLAGRLLWNWKSGSHFQAGVDVFNINWQGGETGPDQSTIGFSLNLTTRILVKTNSNVNALLAGLGMGNGQSHRIVSHEFDESDAILKTDGTLELLPAAYYYLGYSHYWSKSLNSTIAYNASWLDNIDEKPDDMVHQAGTFHVNLIWFPYKLASTGIEYMWGFREEADG